jgi:hypothetical protein
VLAAGLVRLSWRRGIRSSHTVSEAGLGEWESAHRGRSKDLNCFRRIRDLTKCLLLLLLAEDVCSSCQAPPAKEFPLARFAGLGVDHIQSPGLSSPCVLLFPLPPLPTELSKLPRAKGIPFEVASSHFRVRAGYWKAEIYAKKTRFSRLPVLGRWVFIVLSA